MNMSATLNALEIKNKRLEKGLPVFNFGLGENPMPVPDLLSDELKKSSKIKNYESIDGNIEIRKIIKTHFSNENYIVDNVIFGNGSKELLFLIQLVFDGLIIIVSPYWVSYIEHSKILNKKYEVIKTCYENKYKLQNEDLIKLCDKYKNINKLLIFNSPNNPTGEVYTNEELIKLSKVINDNNIIVYADEIYNDLIYLNENINSISYYCPDLTIRSNSLSKNFGLGGWRCGWNTFPKNLNYLYEKMKIAGVSIYTCITTPLLNVTKKAILNKKLLFKNIEKTKRIFNETQNYVYDLLTEKTKLKIIKPKSSWYMFIDFVKYKDMLIQKNINNSHNLVNELIDKIGFICVAGEKFGDYKWCIRISCIDININKLNKDINKLDEDINIYGKNIIDGINHLIFFINNLEKN